MELTVRPIGVIRSPFRERADAPRQPSRESGATGVIELDPGRGFEDALEDLASFEYLWVVYWFHGNTGWRPKVTPPRSTRRRGVFATRSPHRPNPIGLSVVKLTSVSGLRVSVAGVDMLDGTPVLDLKPYLAYADSIPEAGGGWLGAEPGRAAGAVDPGPRWSVRFAPLAEAELNWLRERFGVELAPEIARRLALGPAPHAYRRIRRQPDGSFQLALKEWRVSFRVEGELVSVERICTGFRPGQLEAPEPALEAHRALIATFGDAAR